MQGQTETILFLEASLLAKVGEGLQPVALVVEVPLK
jgi:hypothetical protein